MSLAGIAAGIPGALFSVRIMLNTWHPRALGAAFITSSLAVAVGSAADPTPLDFPGLWHPADLGERLARRADHRAAGELRLRAGVRVPGVAAAIAALADGADCAGAGRPGAACRAARRAVGPRTVATPAPAACLVAAAAGPGPASDPGPGLRPPCCPPLRSARRPYAAA